MISSMLEAAGKAKSGSDSEAKPYAGITTDAFNADDQGDSQSGVGGNHSYRLVRTLDCMCIM